MAEHTIYQRLIAFSMTISMLLSGCYNRFDELQFPENKVVNRTLDIETLQRWHNSDEVVRVSDDIIIMGRVTANDSGDNFYRTFFIQDDSGAVEIRAGIYDLHTIFTRGRNVSIRLKNLAVGRYNGVLQVGKMPVDGGRSVDYITSRYVPDECFAAGNIDAEIEPLELNIEQLSDEYCGRLIKISNLQLIDNEGVVWLGEHVFCENDNSELTVTVQTGEYANFADEIIPNAEISIAGILSRHSESYMLKMRDLNDCKLD